MTTSHNETERTMPNTLTATSVTREALEMFITLQTWNMRATMSTDAERELATYKRAIAQDQLDALS